MHKHGKDGRDAGSTRRALLLGTASGLTASLAGMPAVAAQPAEAATGTGGPTDWLNVVTQYNADSSGATDSTTAIQSALGAALPGQVVYLPAGTYLISQPLNIPPAITVAGAKGGTNAADTSATTERGTVLRVASSFSSSLPVTAAIAMLDCQAGGWPSYSSGDPGANIGIQLRDFFVDAQSAPANVDGIAAYGSVHSVKITDVVVYGATGNGVAGQKNSSSTAGDKSPDGWLCERVLVQDAAKHSFGSSIWQDGVFIACHAQAGGTGGDGFFIDQGSTRLIGCRSDYKQNAFTADSYGTGGGYGPIILSACTSDQCDNNAFNIINSNSQGTSSRNPVIIDGCQAVNVGANGGSGGGGYAGIYVEGAATRVTVSNTQIWATTSAGPDYGARVVKNGVSGAGASQVRISGGTLNGQLAAVSYDGSAADFYIGPDVTQYVGIPGTTTPASGGWIPLAPQNGYANSGSGPNLESRAFGDRIEIIGDLSVPASANTTIAGLPAGYAVPLTQQLHVTIISNSSPPAASVLTPRVYVQGSPAGLVARNIPANTTRIYLNGVVYSSA
ncbi:MAG TPA: glycosyl hydrolase family 28-related protein [Streptosporangiaceae bacterium]|nr:glycosyl hydrolase family 28-related protein [Streptosporangiaceae bacterium]